MHDLFTSLVKSPQQVLYSRQVLNGFIYGCFEEGLCFESKFPLPLFFENEFPQVNAF